MRVQLSPLELDHNYRVEAAIAALLRQLQTAEISNASIEQYIMLEHLVHGEEMTPSHKLSKHDQIVAALHNEFAIDDAEYRLAGDDVQFFRRPKPC